MLWVSLESLHYGALLLHNILAYVALACLISAWGTAQVVDDLRVELPMYGQAQVKAPNLAALAKRGPGLEVLW